MPYTIPIKPSDEPAYKLTCVQVRKRGTGGEIQDGCGWYGKFYFARDQVLLQNRAITGDSLAVIAK